MRAAGRPGPCPRSHLHSSMHPALVVGMLGGMPYAPAICDLPLLPACGMPHLCPLTGSPAGWHIGHQVVQDAAPGWVGGVWSVGVDRQEREQAVAAAREGDVWRGCRLGRRQQLAILQVISGASMAGFLDAVACND